MSVPRAPRLCLTRRLHSLVSIDHSDRTWTLEVSQIGPDEVAFRLGLPCGLGLAVFGPRRGGNVTEIHHHGERLAIRIDAVSGPDVKLHFEGPLSFQIQRDDARTGPKDDLAAQGVPPAA